MIKSPEKPQAPLELGVQKVANHAVRVWNRMDFAPQDFIDAHSEDIHTKENSPAALQEAVTSTSEH